MRSNQLSYETISCILLFDDLAGGLAYAKENLWFSEPTFLMHVKHALYRAELRDHIVYSFV